MGDELNSTVETYLRKVQDYLKDRLGQWRIDNDVRWQTDAAELKGLGAKLWGRWERGTSFPKNMPAYFDILIRTEDGLPASEERHDYWQERVDACMAQLQHYVAASVEEYAQRNECSVYAATVDAPVDSTAVYSYMNGRNPPRFKSYFKLFSFLYPGDESIDGMVLGPLTDIEALEQGAFAKRAHAYNPACASEVDAERESAEPQGDTNKQAADTAQRFLEAYLSLREAALYFRDAGAQERDTLRRTIAECKLEMADMFLLARDLMMREEKYQQRPNNLLKHISDISSSIGGNEDDKKKE